MGNRRGARPVFTVMDEVTDWPKSGHVFGTSSDRASTFTFYVEPPPHGEHHVLQQNRPGDTWCCVYDGCWQGVDDENMPRGPLL